MKELAIVWKYVKPAVIAGGIVFFTKIVEILSAMNITPI